jgi:hypothetical protein
MRAGLKIYIQKIVDMVAEEIIQASISQKWFCNRCTVLHDFVRAQDSLLQYNIDFGFHRGYYINLIDSNSPKDCSFWNFVLHYLFDPVCDILQKRGVPKTEASWVELVIYDKISEIWNELFTTIQKYKIQFDTHSDVLRWMEFHDKHPHFIAKHAVLGRNKSESEHIAKHFYKIPRAEDILPRWIKVKFDPEDNVIIGLRGVYALEPHSILRDTAKIQVCKFNITVNNVDIQQKRMSFKKFLQEKDAEGIKAASWAVDA